MSTHQGPIRIGIYAADIVRARTSSHGIANYTARLVRNMTEHLRDESLVVYTNPEASLELPDPTERLTLRLLPTPTRLYRRLLADNYRIERDAASDNLDILHYPRGFVARWPTGRHRRVATLHDDLPIQYATGRWGRVGVKWRYFASAIRTTLRTADQIITDSQFTRTQLVGWCQEWGIRPPRMKVIYPGVSVRRPTGATKGNYLLLFGSPLPHKQTTLGIELALGYLDRRQLDLNVCVIGELPADAVSDDRILQMGRELSNDQVAKLLAEAQCLIYPSSYEGFGLPPIEAYCAGTPSVFAHSRAATEIMEGIPTMFEDTDLKSFEVAMDTALTLSNTDVAAMGSLLSSRFSPEQAAISTLKLYHDSVLAEPQR